MCHSFYCRFMALEKIRRFSFFLWLLPPHLAPIKTVSLLPPMAPSPVSLSLLPTTPPQRLPWHSTAPSQWRPWPWPRAGLPHSPHWGDDPTSERRRRRCFFRTREGRCAAPPRWLLLLLPFPSSPTGLSSFQTKSVVGLALGEVDEASARSRGHRRRRGQSSPNPPQPPPDTTTPPPALLHIPPSPNPRLLRASPPTRLPRHAPHPCVLPALPPTQPHHVLVPQQLAGPVHTGHWSMLHRSLLLHRPDEARWMFLRKKLRRWSWLGWGHQRPWDCIPHKQDPGVNADPLRHWQLA
jgi:hypothetical protein